MTHLHHMKIKIKNRSIYEDGQVELDSSSILESLFSSNLVENCIAEDSKEIQEFNQWANSYDMSEMPTEYFDIDHENNQKQWKMPQKYKDLDIVSHLYSLCNTQVQKDRIDEELALYNERNMIDILRYLVFLVDTMRSNNILWGVGRGSSVASYVLFLLDIHRVDSLKYNLPIDEFLK